MNQNPKRSLYGKRNPLADTQEQLGKLRSVLMPTFREKLLLEGLYPLKPVGIDIFQINIGKMCNLSCAHCHVDAGPDRKEKMHKTTMEYCIDAIKKSSCKIIDITGGAPEMHPHFNWFIEELSKTGKQIIIRTNLTIIVSNKKYHYLPEFYKKHNIELVASLPSFSETKTDNQRGEGVYYKSIEALKMLNDVGYGIEGSNLLLNLVYNPSGAFLPPEQSDMEKLYKDKLMRLHDVSFNSLFTITNIPINRYLEYLINTENYEDYMEKLVNAFNPVAAKNVMCRNMISISWDGFLYDCDFNQMLSLKVDSNIFHISDFNEKQLLNRSIVVNQHCFGCTAGSGSSCGGTTA